MASTDYFDRFVGTAGTVVAGGHTSDSGHTYAGIGSGAGGNVGLQLSGLGNGRGYAGTASGFFGPVPNWVPGSADYRSIVRVAVLSTPAAGDTIGIGHRLQAGSSGINIQGYYGTYVHGTGVQVFKADNGTYTNLTGGSGQVAASIADQDEFDFTTIGSSPVEIVLKQNGTTLISTSDNSSPFTAAGSLFLLEIPSGSNIQTTTAGIQIETAWAGPTSGPSTVVTPSSATVALGGTRSFAAAGYSGLAGVSPALDYDFTAGSGSFAGGTGVTSATYTAPGSGSSDTATIANPDLAALDATAAITLTSGGVTDYYVATSGSDSNPGSSGSPFLTIAHAVSVSSAGDTIHLNGGDTFAEAASLTSGRTIISHGSGRASIAPTSLDPNAGIPVTATNCDGVNLTNLILKGASSTLVGAVVYLLNTDGTRRTADGVSITGCDLSGAMNGVVAQSASGGTGALNGVTISGNAIHDVNFFGIYTLEAGGGSNFCYSNVQIQDNTIYNVPGATIVGNTTSQGTGIALGNCDGVTGANAAQCVIQRNHIYNCGQLSTGTAGGSAGVFPINSDGVLTQFNVVHDISCGTGTTDGVAYDHDLGTSNCVTQYNYGYNCDGAGFLLDGTGDGHVVRFNLLANVGNLAAGGAVRLNTAGGLQFYNNTVVGGLDNGLLIDSGHSVGKKIYNNIFAAPTGSKVVNIAGTPDATMHLEGNAYQVGSGTFSAVVDGVTYTSLAAFASGTGLEATGHSKLTTAPFTTSTPQAVTPSVIDLMTAFVLSPSATPTLKGQGLNLTSLFSINPATVDFLGNTLGSPYSIGAIDEVSGGGGGPGVTLEQLQDTLASGVTLADEAIRSSSFAIGTVDAAATGLLELLMLLVHRHFPPAGGSVEAPRDGNGNIVVKGAGGTTIATQSCTDDGTTQTLGAAS